MDIAIIAMIVTVFFLIMVLAPSGSAENSVITKYLEFSSQKENPVKLAVNFTTLKSPSTGELPLHGFTICGSIQIKYFRRRQAWVSFYIYKQNIMEETYIPNFIYNGGSIYPNTGAELSLMPHSWSHACTTIYRNSGLVTVVINGQTNLHK